MSPDLKPPSFGPPPRAIYFDGSGHYFTESLLAALAREFPEYQVLRTGDLEGETHPGITVALVDPDRITDIDAFVAELSTTCPAARLVFCYDDEDRGRVLFSQHRALIVARRISLMPMNVRLEAWMSYIRLFLLGHSHVPTSLIAGLWDTVQTPRPRLTSPVLQKLTMREAEILTLAARGEQNKLIASRLQISEHTVKLHMHRVIRKLGVRNRTEAAHCLLSTAS